MIDLHCHILPEIDDGAADLDTAVFMLQMAAEGGTKRIVATPHVIEGKWLPSWEDILTKCQQLQLQANEMKLDLTIHPGAEVCVNWDMLEKISGPGPYCINGSRYMLVELPAFEIPGFTDDFFFTLQTRGIVPILAHPERHPSIIKEPRLLAEWIGKGILVQVNGPSLMGRFGEKAMYTAEYLLSNNMVHCIGSDAHGIRTRKPDLLKAVEKIRTLSNERRVKQLLLNIPLQIISDQEIYVEEIAYVQPTSTIKDICSKLGKLLFG